MFKTRNFREIIKNTVLAIGFYCYRRIRPAVLIVLYVRLEFPYLIVNNEDKRLSCVLAKE